MLKKETKGKHFLNEVSDREDPLHAPLTNSVSLLAASHQPELLIYGGLQMYLLFRTCAED